MTTARVSQSEDGRRVVVEVPMHGPRYWALATAADEAGLHIEELFFDYIVERIEGDSTASRAAESLSRDELWAVLTRDGFPTTDEVKDQRRKTAARAREEARIARAQERSAREATEAAARAAERDAARKAKDAARAAAAEAKAARQARAAEERKAARQAERDAIRARATQLLMDRRPVAEVASATGMSVPWVAALISDLKRSGVVLPKRERRLSEKGAARRAQAEAKAAEKAAVADARAQERGKAMAMLMDRETQAQVAEAMGRSIGWVVAVRAEMREAGIQIPKMARGPKPGVATSSAAEARAAVVDKATNLLMDATPASEVADAVGRSVPWVHSLIHDLIEQGVELPPRRRKMRAGAGGAPVVIVGVRRPNGQMRARVAELLERNLTQAEIARELGVSSPTVGYHLGKLREELVAA